MKFIQDLPCYVGCDTGMFRQVLFTSGVLYLFEGREPSVGYYIKIRMFCKKLNIWFYIVNITDAEQKKVKAYSDNEVIQLAFNNLRFSPEMLDRLYDNGYIDGKAYARLCMDNLLQNLK
jgi:hypothetical protein